MVCDAKDFCQNIHKIRGTSLLICLLPSFVVFPLEERQRQPNNTRFSMALSKKKKTPPPPSPPSVLTLKTISPAPHPAPPQLVSILSLGARFSASVQSQTSQPLSGVKRRKWAFGPGGPVYKELVGFRRHFDVSRAHGRPSFSGRKRARAPLH